MGMPAYFTRKSNTELTRSLMMVTSSILAEYTTKKNKPKLIYQEGEAHERTD